MTVNRWPDTLPVPSAPGFGLSPVDQSIRTNMDVGAQRVRRRTFARLDRISAEFRMTELEFTAFRAFHENAAYGICGASDDFSGWTLAYSTRSVGAALSPDGIAVDRMLETVDNTVHRIGYVLTDAAVNSTTVSFSVTLKSVSRVNARVYFLDRASTVCSVDINLSTGALSGATGLLSYTAKDRGNGWWRVTVTASTGTGSASPIVRVNALSDGGAVTYAGDVTKGLDICELQARLATGYDLFLPTGADGSVLGASGGSAWFYMPVATGGGLRQAEARITGPYRVATHSALRRTVTFEVEVRNA